MALAEKIYLLQKGLPKEETYGLGDQISYLLTAK